MSDEHMQHLQCQTCFVYFPTNQELVRHIGEYRDRERLLLAELERCRMHTARLDGPRNDNDGVDNDDNGDPAENEHVCPYHGCGRKSSFTTRSNLLRHFQTHMECFEVCPFCFETFTQVYRFANHNCKAPPDDRKKTYFDRRNKHLLEVASEELRRLETRKQERGVPNSDSFRPRKLAKKHHVNGSKEASGKMVWDFPETAAIVPSGTAPNNEAPAFTGAGAANNRAWPLSSDDSGWVFTKTSTVTRADESGWAFTNVGGAMHANDTGWAFARHP
ncbi:hypothetical protein B0J18DRAFT_439688 [Chaetomium sp. MPI-SDFR-AT-0129]|nr:hypothetical protein B0J18DRAFT_439688 [Chaetomium sp. MPI-SDFR-AT-0129]